MGDGDEQEVFPVLDAPLYRFSLFRTGESAGGFFIKLHHIISDGWTQMLVCNRISRTYLALLAGEDPSMGEIPSYELHLQEEEEYLAGKAYRKDERYWKAEVEKAGSLPSSNP